MAVRFTQYLQPDGRQVPTDIDLDEEIERKAHALQAKGYVFEIEMLNVAPRPAFSSPIRELGKALAGTDEVPNISMTIENHETEETLSIRLAVNGPDVPIKVVEMINEGYELVFGKEESVETDGGDTGDRPGLDQAVTETAETEGQRRDGAGRVDQGDGSDPADPCGLSHPE